MKKVKTILVSSMMMLGLVATPMAFGSVTYAANNKADACKGVSAIGGGDACTDPDAGNQLGNFIKQIINILLFIIGAVAVIMIIVGGLRYVTSGGDASSTKAARDTILYAVVGLVVAVMAFAIVNFVLGAL